MRSIYMRQPRIFHLIQQAHSALFRASDQALREQVGLTASQQTVLYVLMQQNGAQISAIADQLKMGRSSLTGLIDRMAERGLVSRRRSSADGRSFEIFIEDAGREAVNSTVTDTRHINKSLLEPFSLEERAVIERFLRHVSDNAAAIVAAHTAKKFNKTKAE